MGKRHLFLLAAALFSGQPLFSDHIGKAPSSDVPAGRPSASALAGLSVDSRVDIVADRPTTELLRKLRGKISGGTERIGDILEALKHYPNWYCDSQNRFHNLQEELTDYIGKLDVDDAKTYHGLCESSAKAFTARAIAAGDALTAKAESSAALRLLDDASHVCPTSPESHRALLALISILRSRGELELSALYAMGLFPAGKTKSRGGLLRST